MPNEGNDQRHDLVKLIFLLTQFELTISEIIKDKLLFKNEHTYALISQIWENELKEKVLGLRKKLYDGQYYAALKIAGLTDKELDLKFTILSYFLYGGLVKVDLLDNDRSCVSTPTKLPSITKRIIAGFFDFFNSFLGTLSGVLPMAESIKEFKDMVHFEIEYASEYKIE